MQEALIQNKERENNGLTLPSHNSGLSSHRQADVPFEQTRRNPPQTSGLALDSLNPYQVSETHILQGKLKTIEQLSSFQRDIDIIKENTSQLALLRIRQDELSKGIRSKASQAKNFSSVDDPETLENIARSLSGTINFRMRNIEKKTNELSENSPFDPGPKWSQHQMITDAYSKMDVVSIFAAMSSAGKHENLFSSAKELCRSKPDRPLSQTIASLEEAISSLSTLPNTSTLEETGRELRRSIVGGNYQNAHLAFSEQILSPLGNNFSGSGTTSELKMLAEYFSRIPQENLETMGYFFPNSPAIFKPEFLGFLRKNAEHDALAYESIDDPRFKHALETHRRRLWDAEIPWGTPAALEPDIRLITTTYATIKRLSILTSSLQTALEEIDLSAPESEKRSRREEVIDSYWNLYYDTSHYVAEEGAKALSGFLGGSQINISEKDIIDALASDTLSVSAKKILVDATLNNSIPVSESTYSMINNHQGTMELLSEKSKEMQNGAVSELIPALAAVLEPYARIVERLNQIPEGSHKNLYQTSSSPDASDVNSDPLNTSYDTFVRSTNNINKIVNSLGAILDSAGASTESMQGILHKFVRHNSDHPENATIRAWAKSFPARYSVLGVPWFSIP